MLQGSLKSRKSKKIGYVSINLSYTSVAICSVKRMHPVIVVSMRGLQQPITWYIFPVVMLLSRVNFRSKNLS